VILAAGLLVLLGLGLFVAGIVTGVTVLYWACVAVCVVAAVLLVVVSRQTGTTKTGKAPEPAPAPPAEPERAPAVPVDAEPAASAPKAGTSAPAAPHPTAVDAPPSEEAPDPGVEEVEVTDLLLVVDLTDEVLVVDEHPRYHLAECRWVAGRETIPLPLDEARTDGFTPCAVCSPDRTLAERARSRKHTAD
jgi:hypothetical protein